MGKNDMKIDGMGTISQGEYRNISIDGMGTITGDIECLNVVIMGMESLKVLLKRWI